MTATNDFATTGEDRLLVVSAAQGVLANDGGGLTVTAIDESSTLGGVVIAEDGSFFYAPREDFTGVDTVGYTTSDGSTATLKITVTPRADQPEIRMADASLVGLAPASSETINTFTNPLRVGERKHRRACEGGYAMSFQAITEDPPGTTHRDVFVRAFAADGTPGALRGITITHPGRCRPTTSRLSTCERSPARGSLETSFVARGRHNLHCGVFAGVVSTCYRYPYDFTV
jgi:hypothetical protein